MREKQANGSDIDSAMSVILMSPPLFFCLHHHKHILHFDVRDEI